MMILMLYIQRNLRLDTADAPKWPNYLYLRLAFNEDGKLYTLLYDKRDDLDFPIVNFPYLSSNIPVSPTYGENILHKKFYGRHKDLVHKFDTSASHILKGLFTNCGI